MGGSEGQKRNECEREEKGTEENRDQRGDKKAAIEVGLPGGEEDN